MDPNEIILDFQRRRRSWKLLTILAFIFCGLGVVFALISRYFSVAVFFGGVTFAIFGYAELFLYRCPNCGMDPISREEQSTDPEFCEKCGARLRAQV